MAELLCFDRPEWKWKRLNYQQLYDSTIRFVFDDKIENEEDKELSINK